MHIYFYKEVSSEAIDILVWKFLYRKSQKQLIDDTLLKSLASKPRKRQLLKRGI